MRRQILVVALLTLGGALRAGASDPAALLTQGKLDADMGDRSAAAIAFEAVAEDSTAPSSLRWEALVRLGLVRRDAGEAKAAAEAFERVSKDYRQNKEALFRLVQAVGGAIPGSERWDAIWQNVILKVDNRETNHPVARIEWPGVPPGPRTYTGRAVTLDFKDTDLNDVFRAFADITQLNVVVYPGVRGKATFQAKDLPWDDALDRILGPNGLAATLAGPVLEIARPQDMAYTHHFEGAPIDVDFQELDLREALRRLAERGGRELAADSSLFGRVTITLRGVPWDQAFAIVARVNGLEWRQDGTKIRAGRAKDLG
jgi:hypothetical protein